MKQHIKPEHNRSIDHSSQVGHNHRAHASTSSPSSGATGADRNRKARNKNKNKSKGNTHKTQTNAPVQSRNEVPTRRLRSNSSSWMPGSNTPGPGKVSVAPGKNPVAGANRGVHGLVAIKKAKKRGHQPGQALAKNRHGK
jgi:hypothetical protein